MGKYQEELELLRNYCGKNRITNQEAQNYKVSNSLHAGVYNQSVAIGKIKEVTNRKED